MAGTGVVGDWDGRGVGGLDFGVVVCAWAAGVVGGRV